MALEFRLVESILSKMRIAYLYHGTTLEAARRIWSNGFSPPNPQVLAEELEHEYGVPLGTSRNVMFDDPARRFDSQSVSFSAGWGAAARYARRQGSEARLMILAAIGQFLVGDACPVSKR